MSAVEFLADLAGRGVHLWAEGERLRYRAPSGVLGPDLLAELGRRKQDILTLLTLRDAEPPVAGLVRAVPAPGERAEPFPLTDIQQAYWLGRGQGFELANSAHVYLEHQILDLDVARLREAWRRLVDHHEMLRAVVLPDGTQRILPRVPPYEPAVEDLRGEAAAGEARLAARRGRMAHEGPDVERWPLFELSASLLDGGWVRVHLAISLLVCDAWSFAILLRDLSRLYADPGARLPPLELSFRDYVLALEANRRSATFRRSWEYWRERLADLPGGPELPLAANPAALDRPRMARRSAELPSASWQAFQTAARGRGLTPTAALCAAYARVLATWSKSPRFLLNVLFFKRLPLHPAVGEVVGNFSSTLLLEVDGALPASFAERARRLQARLWQDIEHSHATGVDVLRERSRLTGEAGRSSAPVVFASTLNLDGGAPAAAENPGWRAVHASLQTPQVWLDHQVVERFGRLILHWDAVEALFPPGLLDDLFAAYLGLLHELSGGEPAAWDAGEESLLPAAQLALFAAANATAAPLPAGLLQSGFLARAAEAPGRPAVLAAGRTVTYGELRAGADRLAALLAELGAGSGRIVAVALEKGWEQVVAVLAVLQAGAAYLPLDPGLPAERAGYLLASTDALLVLAAPGTAGRSPWAGRRTLEIDERLLAPGEVPPRPAAATAEDLAYVIFTSGSTGLPKGVMIEHAAALNTVVDVNRRFGVGPEDRVFALSALNFDLSVYDLFGLLAAGGAIVMPAPEALREPALWALAIARERVTVWNSVPALMEMLVDFLEARGERLPATLRLVLLSGDWIPVTLPERIRRLGDSVDVVSLGGATEAAIWSILHPIGAVDPAWTSIPYGRPMANQRFHVLGPDLDPCPVWVPGQLAIGGAGLARGYFGDEEKTRASFFHHPQTGERLYRTGDLGRYLPDGSLEFLGREDFQVKVQGYRIELGEIESALLQHPAVRAAAVIAVGERMGGKRLVGYVVPEPGAPGGGLDLDGLAAHLRAKLPAYMVPGHLVALDALPLTANGKVDRAALGRAEASAGGEATPPRGPAEEAVAGIWEEILGVKAGREQSFFDLGGHSLLAVRLMARIERRFGVSLPLSALFESPTVERLAARLEAGESAGDREALVAIEPAGAAPPFFAVHPVGGGVLCYRELARRLGEDRPFYGLQVPEGAPVSAISLEDLAARYVEAVRTRQPRGPYHLGGWSMGGVVAYEMACQLRAAGEEIAHLALLDAERPGLEGEGELDEAVLVARFARDLGGLLGRDLALVPADLAGLDEEGQLRALFLCARAADLPQDLGAERVRRLLAVFKRNYRTLLAYRPPPYPGRVLLLRAERGAEDGGEPTLGWSAVAAEVEVVQVGGDHYTMVRPPWVDELAAGLQASLARSARSGSRAVGAERAGAPGVVRQLEA